MTRVIECDRKVLHLKALLVCVMGSVVVHGHQVEELEGQVRSGDLEEILDQEVA